MQDERRGFGETSPRRPRTNGMNGFHSTSFHAHSVPMPDPNDDPIDLVAVQADDELINALAAGMTVSRPGVGGYDADDQVAALLAAWRADVDADPVPELVDLDTATSTIRAASRPAGRRFRLLVPVAAAAAMIVFTLGGVSIGAQDARPGDTLWEVSRVLYSERADSVVAAEQVEAQIAVAKEALSRGEPAVAAQVLADAEVALGDIRAEEGQARLAELQSFLEAKAAETPPGTPTEPGAPLTRDPSRPVPPGAGTTAPRPTPAPPAQATTDSPSEATQPSSTVDPRLRNPQPTDPPASSSPQPSTAPGGGEGGPEATPTVAPPTAEGSADTTTPPAQSQGTTSPGTSGGGTATPPA